MSLSRVIEVSFNSGSIAYVKADTAYFYNSGIIFKPTDIDLPASYQVHWADSPQASTTLETIGTAEGVPIPDDLWNRSRVIYGWIYLHPTEDSGITAYEVRIYKNVRAGLPGGTEPTPAEQSTIDQLISALNEAVEQTGEDVESASQSARSASDDADRAERARTGAETAQGKAEEAQESAERAKDDAETSERNASESERKAKGYAETASEKADAITGLTATATTLPDGSQASASYNAETGVMSFGIPKGKDGTDGDDGYSPTANVSKTGKVATITITDKNGTTSAQVEDGEDGIDGISPSVSVTDITGGHRVVITDKDGAKSFDVEDGATGATPNLTIGTVETLEPTDDATATITGTAENPVLNFGIPKGEQGEVTLEDYYKAFPTDTASGAIASFADGADDLPLKSLVVDINPVQDLHGQENPYPAGGGANKWDEEWETGWIGWLGQDADYPDRIRSKGFIPVSEGSVYRVVTSNNLQFFYYDSNKSFVSYESSSKADQSTITIPTGCAYIRFYTYGASYGGTYKNDIAINYPSTATAYAPYENICPISGWTEIGVEQSGINVWDEEWEVGTLNNTTGLPNEDNHNIRAKNYVPCLPDTAYYFFSGSGKTLRYYWYDADYNLIDNNIAVNAVRTSPSNARYFKARTTQSYGATYNHDVSINYPSTDHSYHPYTGTSLTINLGQTVYGGKLDVLSGELVIDRAMVDLGTLEWQRMTDRTYAVFRPTSVITNMKHYPTGTGNPNMICSRYPCITTTFYNDFGNAYNDNKLAYIRSGGQANKIAVQDSAYTDATSFKSAMNGVQLVYELAEPIEIQLTPNQVNSLLGVNNIWADSGDTEVEYRADTKLFIERLTAPDSADMIADTNIQSGQYFMVGNSLYKATANIANGSAIIVGTNCIRKSLSEALNEINA